MKPIKLEYDPKNGDEIMTMDEATFAFVLDCLNRASEWYKKVSPSNSELAKQLRDDLYRASLGEA